MPKFTIRETITEDIEVEAATAQDALEFYINQDHKLTRYFISVDGRTVYDADMSECETEEP